MDIETECAGLLALILQDSPKGYEELICVLARGVGPQKIQFYHNTEYPSFYVYSNERVPMYLMSEGVLSNIPKNRLLNTSIISGSNLARVETAVNRIKNWDSATKLFYISKFINLDNKTQYKVVEVYLVWRSRAMKFIAQRKSKIMGSLNIGAPNVDRLSEETKEIKEEKLTWPEGFNQSDRKFVFGDIGSVEFYPPIRYKINKRQVFFRCLFEAKGEPVKSRELMTTIEMEAKEKGENVQVKIIQELHSMASQINNKSLMVAATKDSSKKLNKYVQIKAVGTTSIEDESAFCLIVDPQGNLTLNPSTF